MNGFTIIFQPAEEGGFTAYVPEVPGVISEGETRDEARKMVIEALHEMLEYRRDLALQSRPTGSTYESLVLSA